jgi:Kdo2-lipid IVA lauroyltransferase/acyltransferase
MQSVGFAIFYAVVWTVNLLPLRILYLFSDLLYCLLFYITRYRRSTVETNLRNSFPGKSAQEIRSIEKKFYRHLSDLFVESLKLIHLPAAEHKKRMVVTNPEKLEEYFNANRDVVALIAHYNNWEWLSAFALYTHLHVITLYKPLHNKQFDNFFIRLRSRNGTFLSPNSRVIRDLLGFRQKKIPTITGFISDQTPTVHELRYWTTFLNQDTAVFTAAERIASKFDMAVVFLRLDKVKRGYYQLTVEPLFDHAAGLPEFAISEAYARRLEEVINEKPEYWLWSHKRWKHKKPAGDA